MQDFVLCRLSAVLRLSLSARQLVSKALGVLSKVGLVAGFCDVSIDDWDVSVVFVRSSACQQGFGCAEQDGSLPGFCLSFTTRIPVIIHRTSPRERGPRDQSEDAPTWLWKILLQQTVCARGIFGLKHCPWSVLQNSTISAQC